MIHFACGINETAWNRHPVAPGPLACVAPVYGSSERTRTENRVSVPAGTSVIQDSGAFSDSAKSRLSFDAAYTRQMKHAERWNYAGQITHRASYDLLIDEVWTEGNRHKRRWSEHEAESAVDETVRAAAWIAAHRDGTPLILSAQGVTAAQYLLCTQRLVPFFQRGDVLGLGGWCITGKMPSVMLPVFRQTITRVIPYAASQGIREAHIWGVLLAEALGELLYLCDRHGITLSTDSAGPSLRPCFGEWGYAEWRNPAYQRAGVERRGIERAKHVQAVREWLATFRQTDHYRAPMLRHSR